MSRAFICLPAYIWYLWLGKNSAITETPMVEARAAKVLMDGS